MTQEYTQGPWITDAAGNGQIVIVDQTALVRHVAYMPLDSMPDEEIKANAWLIAAAPDLLDCLQQFVFLEEGMDAMFKPQIIKEAKAAIAKARSQS